MTNEEEQCKFCKEHCGEVYHFNLAKINFDLEKENAKLKNTLKDWDIWEEGRKKEIAELKAEIEKMKDCKNCDHSENNFCKQRKIFISNNIANGCKYWEVYK